MDGELEHHEVATTLQSLRSTAAAKNEWCEFHLLGEALRGEKKLDFDVTARVMAALADEPTVRHLCDLRYPGQSTGCALPWRWPRRRRE
jgi:negative regulator of sigma E activity